MKHLKSDHLNNLLIFNDKKKYTISMLFDFERNT